MGEWPTRALSDLISLQRGYDLPTETRSAGTVPVVGSGGISGWHNEAREEGLGVVVGRAGASIGKPTLVKGPYWPLNTTLFVKDFKGNNPRWVYYLFEITDFAGFNSGGAQPMLNRNYIAGLQVRTPGISEQGAIADLLGALDDKIAANSRILATLDELASVSYESSLMRGSDEVVLDRVAQFHNRARVPLSSRERQSRVGMVPYYGAAGRIGFVDEAIFDERLVLVGEDGSVMQEDGRPVVQYIWGPSWVNNHAHVLTGKSISTELLKIAVGRSNVAHLVTGAVQPKISMRNLKSLILRLPVDVRMLEQKVQGFAALHRALSLENNAVTQMRDELLPLLMSGKIRVREVEKVVEGVV